MELQTLPKVIRISTAFVKENSDFTHDFPGIVCSSWQLFSFPKFKIFLNQLLLLHENKPQALPAVTGVILLKPFSLCDEEIC